MASHFSTIGFPIENEDAFRRLAEQALTTGDDKYMLEAPAGSLVIWRPGLGIEIWAQVTEGHLIGLSPHFQGKGQLRVGVVDLLRDAENPLEGGLMVWVDPDDDPTQGAYPLRVDEPDFGPVAAHLSVPGLYAMQVAAFAHQLVCYPDDAAYRAAQPEGEVQFAPEHVIPSGLFEPGEDTPIEPTAMMLMAGHVREARTLRNPVTGQPFHHMVVATLGGTFDVVADPEVVEGTPVVGGVVQGEFWLSGLLMQLPEPDRA